MAVLVDAEQLTVRRSDRALFTGLSVTVSDGEHLGVVGINGTGKSTLLRVLAGTEQPDEGTVRRGRGARVDLLDQQPELPPGPVLAAVGEGWEASAVLGRLGMGAQAGAETSQLSGGQAKRVALARVLVQPPELLILDEPTNQLDVGAVAWLQARLQERTGGLVLVTHDRHLLDAVSTRILELDRGRAYVHEGGYTNYLEACVERQVKATEAEAVRRNLARRELAWLQRGAPARTRKPAARVQAARRTVEGRQEPTARAGELQLASATPRLGDQVIELEDVGFRYPGAAAPVLDGVSLALDPRARLAVVGANGTGKSTLLDLMAERRRPSKGRVVRGPTVVLGYYAQTASTLDDRRTVREVVAGPHRIPGGPEDGALMERFWFGGALAFAPVGTLSGGERRRLQLLVVLAARPNVLLLDEPTNDLDLDTLRVLEDYLETWPGALVTVSHDRAFLERVAEDYWTLGPDGDLASVVGGLAGWVAAAGAARGRGGRTLVPRAAPGSPAPAASRRTPGPRPGRSTGARLRELERSMARLERDRDRLQERLSGADDHVALARIGSELTTVQQELDRTEEQWLAVAEEAEAKR